MKIIKPIKVRESDLFQLKCSDRELLRTGIPKDNNSFFYSLFYFSLDFRNMNALEKDEFILEQRKRIIDSISKDRYFHECETIKEQIVEHLRVIVYRLEGILKDDEIFSSYNIERKNLQIIHDLLSTNCFDMKIIRKVEEQMEENEQTSLEELEKNLQDLVCKAIQVEIQEIEKDIPVVEQMDVTKREKTIKILLDTFNIFLEYVKDCCFENFKDSFKTNENWLNIDDVLFLLQNCDFPVNVFLVDATTGMPYQYRHDFDSNKETILLLYFNDYHYEILGQKIQNKLCRNFDANQEVVQEIRKTFA
jgi:hypothetical protein